MINFLKKHDIAKYGYVEKPLSKEQQKSLRVNVICLYKDGKYHFYRDMPDGYYFQCTSPNGMNIEWLKKQDQTKQGTIDVKDNWTKWFLKIAPDEEKKRIQSIEKEVEWQSQQRCEFIAKQFYQPFHKKPMLYTKPFYTPTGIVGKYMGKRVRLYKKTR